jgi:hypothetical protein
MDFNSIKEAVSNITLYDLKAGVRKVQNGRDNSINLPGRDETDILDSSCYELHGDGGEGKRSNDIEISSGLTGPNRCGKRQITSHGEHHQP